VSAPSHSCPLSHRIGGPPAQRWPAQCSMPLHTLPSLHSASVVHGRIMQPSVAVQSIPSAQRVLSGVFTQRPVASSHRSTVHGTLSSQPAGHAVAVSVGTTGTSVAVTPSAVVVPSPVTAP